MKKIRRLGPEKITKNLIFWYKIAYKKNLGHFFENRASSLFYIYNELTSCAKAKKSNEPNSGTFRDGLTDQPIFSVLAQLTLRTTTTIFSVLAQLTLRTTDYFLAPELNWRWELTNYFLTAELNWRWELTN